MNLEIILIYVSYLCTSYEFQPETQKTGEIIVEEIERRSSDPGPSKSINNHNGLKSILKNRRESSPIDMQLVRKMDEEDTRVPKILPGSNEVIFWLYTVCETL